MDAFPWFCTVSFFLGMLVAFTIVEWMLHRALRDDDDDDDQLEADAANEAFRTTDGE
jgi:hypothetical protein